MTSHKRSILACHKCCKKQFGRVHCRAHAADSNAASLCRLLGIPLPCCRPRCPRCGSATAREEKGLRSRCPSRTHTGEADVAPQCAQRLMMGLWSRLCRQTMIDVVPPLGAQSVHSLDQRSIQHGPMSQLNPCDSLTQECTGRSAKNGYASKYIIHERAPNHASNWIIIPASGASVKPHECLHCCQTVIPFM